MTVTLGNRNGSKPSVTEPAPGKIRNRACPHEDEGLGDGSAEAAHAPGSGSGSKRARFATWRNHAWGHVAGHGRVLRDVRPYAARPVSIRDVVAYTRVGGWVPGDHPWWVEAPGYAWGVIIAVPLTITGNIVLFVLQRPLRAAAVTLVWLMLWLAGVTLAPSPVLLLGSWAGLVAVSAGMVLTHPKKTGKA